MSGKVNAPTVRRWTNMLQDFGLFGDLNPEDELVVAIREGRDGDAIAACESLADAIQADLETFEANHPELTRLRNRLLRRDRYEYRRWIEWAADPDPRTRKPWGEPPASMAELRELAWFEDERASRAVRVDLWRKTAHRAQDFNIVPDEDGVS